ncbi:MAG: hypothetical protein JO266_05200 [Acidobacteria bacterium]|nr:hypothetical protein [Acidobacteriota bacterium]
MGVKLAAKGHQGSGGRTGINLASETVLSIVEPSRLSARDVDAVAMNLSKVSSAWSAHWRNSGLQFVKDMHRADRLFEAKVRFSTIATFGTSDAKVPKYTTLRFRYHNDILATGVTVNAKRVITNIDTGSNSYFQLSPAAIDKLGLRRDVARAHVSSSVGFNGELKIEKARCAM